MENNLPENNLPKCIGFIPDGNRRWAKSQSLTSLEGHKKGAEKIRDVLLWCKEAGVKNAVLYAFSTENWKRKQEEVEYLSELLGKFLEEFEDERVSLHFLGEMDAFGQDFYERMKRLEKNTAGREYHFYVALSYGGRAEILAAAKKIAREKTPEEIEDLTEDDFREAMWSARMPDPDLIIRTSGEKRLSNFLTWQSTYSELAFVPTHWPEFSKDEFMEVLDDYAHRQRRLGK